MPRMGDRVKASAQISANLELITLLRQMIVEQQRTNALLQYLAEAKHTEPQQAAVPRDR